MKRTPGFVHLRVHSEYSLVDSVVRIKPRYNADVNQWWLCDEGRYGFGWVDKERLTKVREPSSNGEDVSWEQALTAVSAGLAAPSLAAIVLMSASDLARRDGQQQAQQALAIMQICKSPGYDAGADTSKGTLNGILFVVERPRLGAQPLPS